MTTPKPTPFICRTVVRHDGKRYAPGETLKLLTSQAEPLLVLGAITPTEVSKAASNST
jgi:hypothetical protein